MRRKLALLKKTQILLLACLFVMVAMIVFCAFKLFATSPFVVASAQDDKPVFEIIASEFNGTDSSALWSVKQGGDVVFEPTRGKWSTGDSTAISISIRNAIREKLKAESIVEEDYDGVVGSYCTIQFNFGDINASIDTADGVYNEICVSVNASVEAYTTFSANDVHFEYTKEGEDGIYEAKATPVEGGYALPKDLPYGNYEARLVAVYETSFENIDDEIKYYTTYRYSNWMECSVKKASINLPTTLSIQATYGTTLADMNGILQQSAMDYLHTAGKFVAMDEGKQVEDELKGEQNVNDVILSVRDGSYTVVFEFVPNDDSYARTSVRVAVKVMPKLIYVRIKDAYSLAGDPLVSPDFYLNNPNELVGDDTIDDLRVAFNVVNTETLAKTDGNTVGKFKTIAISGNKNYTIEGHSADTQFWRGGGRYWVYNKRIECIAQDQTKFFVYTTVELMDGISVEITKMNVDEPLTVEGKVFLCAYTVTMRDAHGNAFTPTENYIVCWESNPQSAQWVSAYDGGFSFVKANPQTGLTLEAGQNAIYFFKDASVKGGQNLIGVWIAVGIVAIAVLAVVIPMLRRYLICKNSYKNYVYMQEIVQQSADCENKTENTAQNNAPKTADKKSRHGKKNKQLNGANRG